MLICRLISYNYLKTKTDEFDFQIKTFNKSHDRFLVIDKNSVYHIGASLKDLGKKWFAFSKIELDPNVLIMKLMNGRKEG